MCVSQSVSATQSRRRTPGRNAICGDGPRPILAANITDTLREARLNGVVMPSLTEKEGEADPLATVAARALVLGCRLDTERLFGPRPAHRVRLPGYAWQRKPFQQPRTAEALDLYGPHCVIR